MSRASTSDVHMRGCFTYMLGDGLCHAGCNIFDCAHDNGDCSRDQVRTTCLLALSDALVTAPNGASSGNSSLSKPQVWMQLELDPIEVVVDDGTKQTHVELEAKRSMLWTDLRLFDSIQNPCVGVMGQLHTMSREEAEGDASKVEKAGLRARFWIPDPEVDDLKDLPVTITRTFRLALNSTMAGVVKAGGSIQGGFSSELAYGFSSADKSGFHVQNSVNEEFMVKQKDWDYWHYPFDRHAISITFKTPGFELTTCGTLADGGPNSLLTKQTLDNLLPSRGDYSIVQCKSVSDHTPPFTASEGEQRVFTRRTDDGCELLICIQRIPTSYFQMFLIPQSLVVIASLLAMIIEPTNAGDASGRCSVLFIALLLLAEGSGGIWRGTYLGSWVDLTNLTQISIIAIAIIETWIIFYIAHRRKRPELAMVLDDALRFALPLVYVLVILFLILNGLRQQTGAYICLAGGILMLAASFGIKFRKRYRERNAYRMRLVGTLRNTFDPQTRKGIISKLFKYHDKDVSGSLETVEVLTLVDLMYPHLTGAKRNALMEESDWLNRDDPSSAISFEEFKDTLERWEAAAVGGTDERFQSSENADVTERLDMGQAATRRALTVSSTAVHVEASNVEIMDRL